MKHILIIILFLVSNSQIVFSQSNWKTVFLSTNGIKAKILEESEAKIDTLYLDEEEVYVKSWEIEQINEDQPVSRYALRISEYPSNYIHSDSSFNLIEGFLNSTINSLIQDQNFEYLNSSLDFIDGFPGKNFKFRDKRSEDLSELYVYLIQNYLVELITVSRANNWFSKDKSYFFASLELEDIHRNEKDYGIPVIGEDTYVISFPGTPEINDFHIDAEDGILHTKIKVLEMDGSSGMLAFMAGESKYPRDLHLDEENNREAFYDKSMNGSIKSMNGELISKKAIKYGDLTGREYFVSLFEGKATSRNRIFHEDGNLYTQGVIFITNFPGELGIEFLNSFQLKSRVEQGID